MEVRRSHTISRDKQEIDYELIFDYNVEKFNWGKLLHLDKFKRIEIIDVRNPIDNFENTERESNILKHYEKYCENWVEDFKYNCHYYSFFQKKDYWLNSEDVKSYIKEHDYDELEYSGDIKHLQKDDIILLYNSSCEFPVHSCRFDGEKFHHKCGNRGVYATKTIDANEIKECQYQFTKAMICRKMNTKSLI